MPENKVKIKKNLEGTVVSDKMAKTVVVLVERMKLAPKYRKYHKASTKFKAHDEGGEYHIGDRVLIEETRPLSKDKKWKVVKLLAKKAEGAASSEADLPADHSESGMRNIDDNTQDNNAGAEDDVAKETN